MASDHPSLRSAAGSAAPAADEVVRAVVFDMDGLLLNTEVLAREGLRRAGAEVGLALDDRVCHLMIGVPAEVCRRLLLEHFGDDAPADGLLAAATRHLRVLIDEGRMQLKPGVPELLDYLDRERLPRALATSSLREKTLHHLRAAGIEERFDTIVSRDEVARGKPFPDLYQEASRRLGKSPHHCLALEDSYNGVRAAAAAGLPVVMVPDLLPPTPEMQQICTAVFDDLHDVLAWLKAGAPAFTSTSPEVPGTAIASSGVPFLGAVQDRLPANGSSRSDADADALSRR